MTRLRLADIAAQAGVSEATVSRVINNKPSVSAATRQQVLTAIDVLGFERPPQLRRQSAGLVGLIVPELTNPIFPAFAQTIQITLATNDFTAVLCTQTPGGVHEDEYTQMLLDRGVAGIIFVSGQHADTQQGPERYQRLRAAGLPIVLINGYMEGIEAPFISNDDAASMELAVRHLAQLGHERIGLAVGQLRYVPSQRKIAGFTAAMKSILGVDDVGDLVEATTFTVEGGTSAAIGLIGKRATAIITGSDMMALGAIQAARTMGLRVPEDLSVVGYDDSTHVAFTDPPLTTLRQNVPAMSEAAVRALLDEIQGNPPRVGEFIFRPDLVVRGSTAIASRRGETGRSDATI